MQDRKNLNLWEHSRDVHGCEEVDYRHDIVNVHTGDPFGRQLSEVMIIQAGAKADIYSLMTKVNGSGLRALRLT